MILLSPTYKKMIPFNKKLDLKKLSSKLEDATHYK